LLRPVTTVPFGEKYIFQNSDAVSATSRRSEEEEERGGGEKKGGGARRRTFPFFYETVLFLT